jgi:hypothetical protein
MKKIAAYCAVLVIISAMNASSVFAVSPAAPMMGLANTASGAFIYSPDASPEIIFDEKLKRISAAFIRVGCAPPTMIYMMDKDLKYYYNKSWGLMVDCFFYRMRNRSGNGFDIGARFTYRNYKIGEDIQKKHNDLLYEDNKLHMMSWDVCFRGIIGGYFLYQLWQVYLLAAPRLLHYHAVMRESRTGGDDKMIDLVSIGIIGGAGIEVTLCSIIGIFAEYNIGYTPVGKSFNNVEGHQVYVGITWRTQVR